MTLLSEESPLVPPSQHSAKLGAFVKKHRLAKGLSLSKLAELSGISKTGLFDIEQGLRDQPRTRHLRALAEALDIEPIDLYTIVGYVNTPEGLPEFGAYLRTTTDMPEEDLAKLEEYFDFLRSKHAGPAPGEDEA